MGSGRTTYLSYSMLIRRSFAFYASYQKSKMHTIEFNHIAIRSQSAWAALSLLLPHNYNSDHIRTHNEKFARVWGHYEKNELPALTKKWASQRIGSSKNTRKENANWTHTPTYIYNTKTIGVYIVKSLLKYSNGCVWMVNRNGGRSLTKWTCRNGITIQEAA